VLLQIIIVGQSVHAAAADARAQATYDEAAAVAGGGQTDPGPP
jgi:hypothetical protein